MLLLICFVVGVKLLTVLQAHLSLYLQNRNENKLTKGIKTAWYPYVITKISGGFV